MSAKKRQYHLVGYKIDLDDIKENLLTLPALEHVNEYDVRWEIFTTVHYQDNQDTMRLFHQKMEKRTNLEGFIRALFVHGIKRGKTVVAEILILGKPYYVTIVRLNESGPTLHKLKQLANEGKLGERIELDPKIRVKLFFAIVNTAQLSIDEYVKQAGRLSAKVTGYIDQYINVSTEIYGNPYIQKLSNMISVNEKIPDGNVWVLTKGEDGEFAPTPKTMHDLCKNKKVVIFGLPGAFTTICSSKQVPEYASKLSELHAAGIDAIYCVSVNDPFVMHYWGKDLGIDTEALPLLADGDASWHSKMGLTQHLDPLGTRAQRYSMVVDDLVVKILNVEEPGPKCYRVSGPNLLLEQMQK